MTIPYQNPIDLLIHSTVRIECSGAAGTSSGSGYFFDFLSDDVGNHVPCIVTNKHVIEGAVTSRFAMTLTNGAGIPLLGQYEWITISHFRQQWICHPDPQIDLAIFAIGPHLLDAWKRGKKYHYVPIRKGAVVTEELLSELSPMEDIIMIGYPNGIWDSKHNLPIIRKGITATHPKFSYNGKPEFMIDAACFPGSSGSPVFLANIGSYMDAKGSLNVGHRVVLLGTLYAGPQHTATGEIVIVEVPTDTKSFSISSIPNNLGLVIQGAKLLDFNEILKRIMGPNPIIHQLPD